MITVWLGAIVLLLIAFCILASAYLMWCIGQEYFIRKGR